MQPFLSIMPDPAAPGGLPDWGAVDLPFLLILPVLLIASGFFSGAETALFGLSDAQRTEFSRHGTLSERAVAALLADERMLLITILLANMTINVLYFVVTAVLMLRAGVGVATEALLGVIFLLIIVILGEVGPKTAASASRIRFALLCAPLLLTVHRIIGPLRTVLSHGVVGPLSRLTAPHGPVEDLDEQALRQVLDHSGRDGVLDDQELRILRDVVTMRRYRVRDVMTPRVRMLAVPTDATRADVEAMMGQRRLTKLPVYRTDLDDIVGILHVKRYLLSDDTLAVTDPTVMSPPLFAPEIATLDQLLDLLRRRHAQSAIVVDEYGGTEGIVAVEDVVEELVGDIVSPNEDNVPDPRLVGFGTWEVVGRLPVRELRESFGIDLVDTRARTLSGVIAERLGRPPRVGDVIDLGTAEAVVDVVERRRARRIRLILPGPTRTEGDAR